MSKYVVIELDGKELKLSPDKAEKLYDKLHKLYGQKNSPYIPYTLPIEPYKYPCTLDKFIISWGPNSTYIDDGLSNTGIT